MQKLMLLGDEAIAQGALDAGLSGVYAYPGTPSTEITEYIQKSKQAIEGNVHRTWSANEKTAMEAAIGMSYAGKRALVCMKHVGLNVAADAFINSAITGANGGLVIVGADDPSMHSSQNEQDSRFYGKFSFMPILEPSNQQEAYDLIFYAFELSEKMNVPVLFRITTRLAHSRAAVARRDSMVQKKGCLPKNLRQYVLLPAIARKQYTELLEKQPQLEQMGIDSGNNRYIDGNDKHLGIITTGIAYNYLLENYPDRKIPHPVLKITQYPVPIKLIEKLATECKTIMCLEEGFPFVEEQLKGYLSKGLTIKGRLDGTLPRTGELNPNHVAAALGLQNTLGSPIPAIVKGRPPKLCDGCPHTDSYIALNEAIASYGKGRVFADIGCYTLAALPPLEAINSCVDMGASITMAKGAADAGIVPAVAVIGDSTFTHSGMTALLDAIIDKSPITVLILDNATTGMTGGQASHALGRLEQIVLGLGVEPEHLHVVKPLRKNHDEMVKIYKKELEYQGVSVIIPRRECIQTLNKRMRAKFATK
ncbi:MAG: indolepyruvate ferredoxin oxidoreductase [Bacteroidia bacterium]|jgi:indolepyruvate ferredoxin oxidoreductase alpha subunit|nr:thiamine pyrophosphate-dependent enzyme [Bacteroidales bacterium]NCD42427.1 indolepyruvate ferredoxin oxidoreductase [Bacteroidia bacterium]MDD2322713.1 thiamine pyrophosphate-dependent enzyme [Bacteroidales bacterium]MDD3010511.1 thiamine pyrophosphate-dependent enzyme [Bacteroidales bacterium]MDD3960326.1 thiamine pyrophosphate-dependent enzyme [Bacteroidales bacterium]